MPAAGCLANSVLRGEKRFRALDSKSRNLATVDLLCSGSETYRPTSKKFKKGGYRRCAAVKGISSKIRKVRWEMPLVRVSRRTSIILRKPRLTFA